MSGENNNHPPTLLPIHSPADLEPSLLPTAAAPPTPAQEPLKKLLSVMRGRWVPAVVLGVGLALMGAVLGYFVGRHNLTYTSTGMIRLYGQPERLIYDTPDTQPILNYDRALATQAQLIKGPRVLSQAANSPELTGIDYAPYPDVRTWLSKGLEVARGDRDEMIFVSFTDPEPKGAFQAATAVVKAYRELESEEATGSAASRRDRLSNLTLNTDQDLQSLDAKRRRVTEKFRTNDLKKLHDRLLDTMYGHRGTMESLRQQLAGAAVDVKALDAQVELDRDGAKPGEPDAVTVEAPAPPAETNDPDAPEPETGLSIQAAAEVDNRLRQLVVEKELLEQDLQAMLSVYLENHRGVKPLRARIDSKEKQIQTRYAEVKEMDGAGPGPGLSGNGPVEQLKLRYLQVRADLAGVEREVGELAIALMDLDEIDRDIVRAKKTSDDAENRLKQLNFEQGGIERVEIAGMPEEPHEASPDSRRRMKMLTAGGLVFGGALGFGIVLMIGILDHRMRSLADAQENFITTPVLGILPTLPTDMADPGQAALGAHCVHQIRTLLQIGPDSQGRRVFTVTSASPQDGKTSLVLSLGLSYAASGAKTLLIDCDLGFGGLTHRMNAVVHRRIGQVLLHLGLVTEPQIEQAMHISRESGRRIGETLVDLGYLTAKDLERALGLQERAPIGLLDAITGDPLERCVAETGIENLHILPIGTAGAQHVARLSPMSIRRLIEQARAQFDVVLVDTGSVLGSLEASHMAVESDGVVLVVSRGGARDLAEQALSHLYTIGARVAGLVFNRASGRDVEIVAERSVSSVMPRGGDDGPRRPSEGATRMGPLAGAVVASSRISDLD